MSNHTGVSRSRRLLAAILAALCLGLGGCGLGQVADAVKQATDVIDNGIRDIGANSSAWQVILQRVAADLPKEVSETIRLDAQSLANRSIATAGIEFRCDADFLGARAIASLQALKTKLLGGTPLVTPPSFCQVDPASVDLNAAPARWSTLQLSGYDLDHPDAAGARFAVSMLTTDGRRLPLPESLVGRTTHYQVTVNIGGLGQTLHQQKVAKIVVSWDGKTAGLPEAVVIAWRPARQTLGQRVLGATSYMPPRTGGDRDFDTGSSEPTDLVVGGEMLVDGSSVKTRVSMYAREREPDHTKVEGTSPWSNAYTAPAGWRIVSANPTSPSTDRRAVTSHGVIKLDRPAGEVVEYFEVWVDRDGDEAGTYSRVTAHWRRVDIVIEQTTPSWLT